MHRSESDVLEIGKKESKDGLEKEEELVESQSPSDSNSSIYVDDYGVESSPLLIPKTDHVAANDVNYDQITELVDKEYQRSTVASPWIRTL